ncbi:MAG: FGGY-family carbohydrate kinase [Thermoproteota archaeon]
MGVTEPSRVSCVLGTCTNIEAYSDRLPLDPEMRLQAQLHVVPNCYLAEGGIGSSGSIYRWFRDNFGEAEVLAARKRGSSPYALMDAEAGKAEPGSSGLIMVPYFTGSLYPHWNADDRGILVGLRLKHGKGHVLRAIMEGVAYEYARMAEDAERVTGAKIGQVRFMGGGARSKIWPKIIVDVLGVDGVVTKNAQAGALGAAILGSKACGVFKGAKDAAESMVKVGRRVEFDREAHERYRAYYRVQGEVYGRIQDLVNELSRLNGAR